MASHFGKGIADRVASRLTDRTTLSLHQVRNITQSAAHLKSIEDRNWKVIAAAVTSDLTNATGADLSLPPLTGDQIRGLGWTDQERRRMLSELTIADIPAFKSAAHTKLILTAENFETRQA